MASEAVRLIFDPWILANKGATVTTALDLTPYLTITDVGSNITDTVVLYDYLSALDSLESIGSPSTRCWREIGQIDIYVVQPVGFDMTPLLTISESIRIAAKSINQSGFYIVSTETPTNAKFGFDAGFDGVVFRLNYQHETHA